DAPDGRGQVGVAEEDGRPSGAESLAQAGGDDRPLVQLDVLQHEAAALVAPPREAVGVVVVDVQVRMAGLQLGDVVDGGEIAHHRVDAVCHVPHPGSPGGDFGDRLPQLVQVVVGHGMDLDPPSGEHLDGQLEGGVGVGVEDDDVVASHEGGQGGEVA